MAGIKDPAENILHQPNQVNLPKNVLWQWNIWQLYYLGQRSCRNHACTCPVTTKFSLNSWPRGKILQEWRGPKLIHYLFLFPLRKKFNRHNCVFLMYSFDKFLSLHFWKRNFERCIILSQFTRKSKYVVILDYIAFATVESLLTQRDIMLYY